MGGSPSLSELTVPPVGLKDTARRLRRWPAAILDPHRRHRLINTSGRDEETAFSRTRKLTARQLASRPLNSSLNTGIAERTNHENCHPCARSELLPMWPLEEGSAPPFRRRAAPPVVVRSRDRSAGRLLPRKVPR